MHEGIVQNAEIEKHRKPLLDFLKINPDKLKEIQTQISRGSITEEIIDFENLFTGKNSTLYKMAKLNKMQNKNFSIRTSVTNLIKQFELLDIEI